MTDGPSLPPPDAPMPEAAVGSAEPNKAWWKKWWVITIGVAAILIVIGAIAGGGSDDGNDSAPEAPVDSQAAVNSEVPAVTEASEVSNAPVSTDAPSATDAPVETDPPSSGDSLPGAPQGATGDRSSPVPTGAIADIGDGYRLQVLSVTDDATAEVMAGNEFNDPPAAGARFTIVAVALGYYGFDNPQSGFSTTISAVGPDNKELDSSCGVIPQPLNQFNDIFGGGVIRGNLCFVTTPADSGALQIYASAGFTGGDVFLDASATPSEVADMPTLTGIQAGTSSATVRQSPTPIGTSADVGSDWSFAITGPATDITDSVLSENQFNDAPPDGFRFVGVPVKLEYSGVESSNAFTVTTGAVGDSNVAYGTECGVIPGGLDSFTDVFAGGVAEGLICFVVPGAEVASVKIYAGAFFEDAAFFATQ